MLLNLFAETATMCAEESISTLGIYPLLTFRCHSSPRHKRRQGFSTYESHDNCSCHNHIQETPEVD